MANEVEIDLYAINDDGTYTPPPIVETVMDKIVAYYISLLIIQYRGLNTANKTIEAFVRPSLMNLLPTSVQDAFNIDTAIGIQLNTLGKYIGIQRRVNTFTKSITLSDEDFRLLLKIKTVSNNLGSSLLDIQNFIKKSASQMLKVFDDKNMTLSYYINSTFISSDVSQAMAVLGMLPKPIGVTLSSVMYIDTFLNIFGFQSYTYTSSPVSGFNDYNLYHEDRKFLTYEEAFTIPV